MRRSLSQVQYRGNEELAELPKFVVERLRRASSEGVPGIPEHPEPNLLAGFQERSLLARERGLVLDHLAQCAACRELVALSLPEVERTAVAPLPRSFWTASSRWAAVASAAAVLMVAIVLSRPHTNSERAVRSGAAEIASSSKAAAVVERAPAAPSPAAKREAAPSRSGALDKFKTAAVAAPSADLIARAESAAGRKSAGNFPTPPARFVLSPSGTLLRSTNGDDWAAVAVSGNTVFHAVSAVGPDVWVGGAAGALYHSADSGQHWQQMHPSVDGVSLQEDVLSLQFADAERGKVTTSDEVWATSDGGQTWRRSSEQSPK
jgi:hypothetical protein